MPEQKSIATNQRRNLILEAIQRLSKTRSWVTQRDLLADLRGQGYDLQKHHVLRDLRALIDIHPELERNDESDENGVPKSGVEYGYRWTAKDAPPATGLSIAEALSLVLVSRHLKTALPATLSCALTSLFERAESTLNLQQKNGVARWKDLVGVVAPVQPMLPPKVSDEVINVIHQALIANEQFIGVYRNFKGEEKERTFNPLGIMVREPAVYLVAVVEEYAEPRFFAVHRFSAAKRNHTALVRPEGFELDTFLESQGNFGSGKLIPLKGRIDSVLARILTETPLGKDQVLSEPDAEGWRILSVKVRDNWSLKWWLLSHINHISVMGPKALRESIAQTVQEGVDRQAKKQRDVVCRDTVKRRDYFYYEEATEIYLPTLVTQMLMSSESRSI